MIDRNGNLFANFYRRKKRLILPQKLTHANAFLKISFISNKIFVTLMGF